MAEEEEDPASASPRSDVSETGSVEEDARLETKTYRQIRWSDGDLDLEEITIRGGGEKRVVLVWGRGVDEIIP